MKKIISAALISTVFLSALPIYAQDTGVTTQTARRGEAAGNSIRNANVLSMMGWGLGLAVGIALLCGYLEQSTAHSH